MEPIFLATPDDTDRFGTLLAQVILNHRDHITEHGLNIRLDGNLGAGKTATTRAMLRALGVDGRIKSPTFTLLETYTIDDELEVFHYDFYRFETPEEFLDAGFRDDFAPGHITVCEWCEKAEPCLPEADLTLALQVNGTGRNLTVTAHNTFGELLTTECIQAWH